MYSRGTCCMRKINATPKLLSFFWVLVSSSGCHACSHELLAHFSYYAVGTSVENTVGRVTVYRHRTQTAGVVPSAGSFLRMHFPSDGPPFLCRPLWPWNSQYVLGNFTFLFKQPCSFQRWKLRAGHQRLSRAIKSV